MTRSSMRFARPGPSSAFCQALLERGLVGGERLRERLAMVETLDPQVRAAVAARIPSS